jgi:hypothetical protein
MKRRAVAATVVLAASVGAGPDNSGSGFRESTPGVVRTDAVAQLASGVITGVILTDTATPQPVRRAAVRLTGDASATSRIVGTNDEGRFVFDRLPAGRFTLSATKAGFVPGFHASTRPGRGPGVPVAVADGQTVDVAIKLLPGAVITGLITDARGTPVPGVTVAAVDSRASGAAALPVRVITDDRGMYRVFGLAPGEYLVSALPQLLPSLAGRGFVPGAAVTAVTDADVQWAKALGVASAPLGAGAAGGPAPPPRPVAYAPVFYPGTTDAAAAATIRVASGEERVGVDMSLQIAALARVAGTIADGSGQPVTSATVMLIPKRGDQPSPVDALVASGAIALPRAIVSASGFAFAGVAPGQFTLVARTGSGQRGVAPAEAGMPTLWSVLDLIVDGTDRTDLSLRLLPGLKVTGRYVFERGTAPPADPSALNLSFLATNPMPGVASTFSAALKPDGTFQVPSLPPGSYVVRADPAARTGAPWTLMSAIVNDRDLADRPILANPGAGELSDVVVTFTDRPAEISGRLIDASGRPVARYSIVAFTPDRSLWLPNARRIRVAQPATDGSFAISGLPAGEYAIAAVEEIQSGDLADSAFLSQLLASAFKITLKDGERKRQDLKIGR